MSEIKPAMTDAEWASARLLSAGVCETVASVLTASDVVGKRELGQPGSPDRLTQYHHALAALCLHSRPFGFTLYDVRLLRHAADYAKPAHPELRDLADRIEALLPPAE